MSAPKPLHQHAGEYELLVTSVETKRGSITLYEVAYFSVLRSSTPDIEPGDCVWWCQAEGLLALNTADELRRRAGKVVHANVITKTTRRGRTEPLVRREPTMSYTITTRRGVIIQGANSSVVIPWAEVKGLADKLAAHDIHDRHNAIEHPGNQRQQPPHADLCRCSSCLPPVSHHACPGFTGHAKHCQCIDCQGNRP